jgi:hypothetical protein
MNFWVFAPTLFAQLAEKFEIFLRANANDPDAEFLLPEVVNDLIAEGRLTVLSRETPGPWFGLTYQEDKAEVMRGLADLASRGVYPSPLW